jgi:lipase chaperone LimK
MNKKILIGFILILVIGLGTYIIVTLGEDSSPGKNSASYSKFMEDPNNQQFSDNLNPLGSDNSLWDEALSPFQGENRKAYLEILEDLRSGKINFVWEIWALRSKCPEDYTASQCDATLLAYIDKNYTSPDKEKIKDLYISYFKYENEMRQLEMPENLNFTDKYEILKEKRRSILGDEKSELIFGMEEAQVNFMEGSYNFIESTKNMSPEERVRKYEDLRKKTYGPYYENVMSREDKYDHYSVELQLRESELAGLSPEEKEAKYHSLEVKHFGKERAALIAKARKEEAQENAKLQDLAKQEEELLAKNPNLSAKEKEQKIKELRVKTLGEDEAEAYSRRIEFEKFTEEFR